MPDMQTIADSVLRIIGQTDLPPLKPDGGEPLDVTMRHVIQWQADEIERLRDQMHPLARVLDAATFALALCRTGMASLTGDGVHSPRFNSDAEQFAAAWRDLRAAVEAAEAAGGE